MTGAELIKRIGNPYEGPMLRVREQSDWPNLSNPLHVALLLIDFDTELCMNSILGFLENSTGAYLNQTLDAFQLIGAKQIAATLAQIRDAMQQYSVSHQQLRSDFDGTTEHQISSFAELHPNHEKFAETVCQLADALYLSDESQESPFPLLEVYLEKHSAQMLAQLDSTVA